MNISKCPYCETQILTKKKWIDCFMCGNPFNAKENIKKGREIK